MALPGADPDPEAGPLAPPPSTLCRLENRVDRKALVRIAAVLVDQFLAAHAAPPEALILDFDATDFPIHGHQDGRFFHGYYDNYCFLPLYVFCGEQLLVAYLRPSNIDAAEHSRAILKLLVQRLRAAWPGVKITIRGDSGFCRWRLMRWCDSAGIGYVLGLARRNTGSRSGPGPGLDRAGGAAVRPHRPAAAALRLVRLRGRQLGPAHRRVEVIAKADGTAQGARTRGSSVVNVPGDPRELYEDVYCQRGDMENRIKEQQLDLFAGRTSCHRFAANQFRLLSAAAYLLVQALHVAWRWPARDAEPRRRRGRSG